MAFAGKPDDGVPSKRRMLYRGQRPPRLQFEPIEEQDARNHRFARHRAAREQKKKDPTKPKKVYTEDIPDPPESDGPVLVRTLALGVCGTDREILDGRYGSAPPGQQRLVLGHESLGAVEAAPAGCGLAPGDLIVGIVRRPDPVPCLACAAGEWDMCRNGRYTERGIKERHGYGAERFRLEPEFAIRIDPALGILGVLLEPASILAKAWDHTERIGHRARAWQPKT